MWFYQWKNIKQKNDETGHFGDRRSLVTAVWARGCRRVVFVTLWQRQRIHNYDFHSLTQTVLKLASDTQVGCHSCLT